MNTHRNETAGWRHRRRGFLAAALFFASVSAVQADDNNLTDEVRLLREQNALLQKQVSSQGGALDALTKKVGQLESAQAARETADRKSVV